MRTSLLSRRPIAGPAAVLASVLAALASTACGDPAGPAPDATPLHELPRALSAGEQELIVAGNAFGLDLLGRVVAEDEQPNIVLSPLSASMALGMTMNGAAGPTFDAMGSTLGFADLEQDEINDAYRDLISLLLGLDESVRFSIGNSVWARQGIPFHDSFFEAVRDAFDARVESRDFSDPATVADINAWVADATEGYIDSIVDGLAPNLVMLLVNAIFFEGTWTTSFDPADTRTRPFQREDGTSVDVDMMSLTDAEFSFAQREDYAAVELPYGRGAWTMVVVVPTAPPAQARDFVRGLDEARWNEILDGLAPTELDVLWLPRFSLSYDTYLNQPLKDMGMGVAFDDAADFSRLSPLGEDMCISFVRQKTFMEVDEAGTRAAAATGVGVGVVSLGPALVADRPFLLAIRERLSGTILFAGWIGDPSAEEPEAPQEPNDCR